MSDPRSTSTPSEARGSLGQALARSHVYRVLARAFRAPVGKADEPLADLAARARAEGAGHLPPEVDTALAELAAASTGLTPARRLADLVAAFGHVVQPDCPLYEAAGEAGDPVRMPQRLADLIGFYRAWGLEVAPGAHERADHLALELEFMHYLAYREAYAGVHHGPERVAAVREAQRAFLAEHLARWASAVGRAVGVRAAGWLAAAGQLLERFLTWEAETHRVWAEPVSLPVPVGPGPADPEETEEEP